MTEQKEILTPREIIEQKYEAIEEKYREVTEKILGWGEYTDVLYSFLGIFVLGVYIFEENKENKYTVGKDNIIRLKNEKKRLYSRKYITDHFEDFKDVAEELKELAEVYCSIGNVIPVWPGANELRGKLNCYDIPDIFFPKFREMEEVYLRYILNKEPAEVCMTRILTDSPKISNIEKILSFSKDEYRSFVKQAVNEIKERTREIGEKWL